MKKIPALLLASCALILFPGCGHKDGESAKAAPAKKLHLAFVANSAGEYWSVVNLGCDIAAQQSANTTVDFRFPADRTVAAQQELITNLLASGVDGIAISPIDADSQTDFLNNLATNTLLVCADSDAANTKRVCYIGTDNVLAGKQAAELIKAALPEGGKIILAVGYANAQNTKDRIQGIRDGLAGSKIEIIDTLADGQKITEAQKNADDALAKYPDLAGMVGISGYHGPALLAAVSHANKTGQVKLVCFDDNSETLAGIVAGTIYGTIAQNPFQIGQQTILHMDKYLRGDKMQLSEGKILTSSRALTKDNVENFIAERKAIFVHLHDEQP
ncbi:MAG TPA: substrate-binding domain-containing protein [bacterium]|nr:substrate-binding domain-containing protein [bacterium]